MNHVHRRALVVRRVSIHKSIITSRTVHIRLKSDSAPKTDEPIKYENTRETWEESFLTPYLRKYPTLLKSARFVYNGLGLYSKQTDAIRSSKYWYMTCAERDIIENEFLYKGKQTSFLFSGQSIDIEQSVGYHRHFTLGFKSQTFMSGYSQFASEHFQSPMVTISCKPSSTFSLPISKSDYEHC